MYDMSPSTELQACCRTTAESTAPVAHSTVKCVELSFAKHPSPLNAWQERCLERIVALPTPLGAEAAALLREHAPQSRLLRVAPPAPEGDDAQMVPRLAAIAAMQQVGEPGSDGALLMLALMATSPATLQCSPGSCMQIANTSTA